VTGLLLFLHGRLAAAAILLALILALWGTYQYARHNAVGGGFRATYLMLCGVTALQGLIGVLNLLAGTKLHNPLHVVYGIFAVVFLPGLYFYSESGRSPKIREAALLAAACWIVLVALGRGWVTGQ
jgi:CDP-diglyceride synthetase